MIIAGGAGNANHLKESVLSERVNAVATANLFNFTGNGLPNTRKKLGPTPNILNVRCRHVCKEL